jgi:hypothetical protein
MLKTFKKSLDSGILNEAVFGDPFWECLLFFDVQLNYLNFDHEW